MTARYLLRTDVVRDAIDRKHMSHRRVARRLGLTPAYWSQLLNRRRALTPDMRHLLLTSGLFADLGEDGLWDRIVEPPDDPDARAG